MQKISMVDNEAPKKAPAKKTPATKPATGAPAVKAPPKPAGQAKAAPAKKPAVSAPKTAAASTTPAKTTPAKATSAKVPNKGDGPTAQAAKTPVKTPVKTPTAPNTASKTTSQPKNPVSSPAKATSESVPARRKPVPPEVRAQNKKPATPSADTGTPDREGCHDGSLSGDKSTADIAQVPSTMQQATKQLLQPRRSTR